MVPRNIHINNWSYLLWSPVLDYEYSSEQSKGGNVCTSLCSTSVLVAEKQHAAAAAAAAAVAE